MMNNLACTRGQFVRHDLIAKAVNVTHNPRVTVFSLPHGYSSIERQQGEETLKSSDLVTLKST